MEQWISHPGVQAGLLPFVVALAVAAALARTRALAVAVLAGVIALLAVTIGFSLEPFTSVRKALVAVLALTGLALGLDLARVPARTPAIAGLALLSGVAAVWSMGRVLAQQEGSAPWLAGAAAFVFAAAVVAASLAAGAASSLRASIVGAALGWGGGVLALLGASGLLAQIGLAAGSACAAVALVQLLRRREAPPGWSLAVPAAATAALVGVLANATAELKAWTLVPLVLVPFAAYLATPASPAVPVPPTPAPPATWTTRPSSSPGRPLAAADAAQRWLVALRLGLAALVPAALACFLAWRSAHAVAS